MRNPAALAAFMRGDTENARVASTPGGIEAQEAAGQAVLIASSALPREIYEGTREQLEAIGFRFGADVDELFVAADLPAGWSKRATSHSMNSELLDDKGRVRATIFYKAAFYDRRADMRMRPRYSRTTYADGATEHEHRTLITDCDKELHCIGTHRRDDYPSSVEQGKAADAWLDANFPSWRDPFAYWNDATT